MELERRIKETLPKLDKYFLKQMEERNLPGLCAGIVYKGKTIYAKTFGYSDVENNVKMDPTTTFQIASISKTMTAIGLMQQWEQDKFKLDDDVNKYLPQDRVGYIGHKDPDAPKVTFRQLLTHTSGIGELKTYSDLLHIKTGFYFVNPKDAPVLPLEDRLKDGIPSYVVPGTKWSYSNHGISLLGYLLEQFSGETFHEYVLNHIFKPLEMDRTDAILSDRVKDNLAWGYKFSGGEYKRKKFRRLWGRPAAGVYSCLNDVIKYMKVLINKTHYDSTEFIKPETFDDMRSPHYKLDPRLEQIGLVFHLYSLNGYNFSWHGGQSLGYNCSMHVCPEADFGLIVMANNSTGRPTYWVAKKLLWELFDTPNTTIPNKSHPKASDPAFLKTLKGNYGNMRGWLTNTRDFPSYGEFKIYMKKKKLMIKTLWGDLRKGVPLYPVDPEDPNIFMMNEGIAAGTIEPNEKILFRFDENDKSKSFCHNLNEYPKKRGLKSLRSKIWLLSAIIVASITAGIIFSIK